MNTTLQSSAAQVMLSLIPIVGIGIGGVVVFFSLLWHHHEVKLQIKMGTYRKQKFNLKIYSLLIGLVLVGVGLILSLFFALTKGSSPALLGGLIPLGIGICLLVFYGLYPEDKKSPDEE